MGQNLLQRKPKNYCTLKTERAARSQKPNQKFWPLP